MGDGRDGKERKINLTIPQGRFLYYLPFPDTDPLSVDEIMQKADNNDMHKSEILDITNELLELKIIEKVQD